MPITVRVLHQNPNPRLQPAVFLLAAENHTVRDVKARLEGILGIPRKQQILVHDISSRMLRDELETVQAIYNEDQRVDKEPSTITLTALTKMDEPSTTGWLPVINVVYNTGEITMAVDSSTTVGQLKVKIDEQAGVPPGRQELTVFYHFLLEPPITVTLSDDNVRLRDVLFTGATVCLDIRETLHNPIPVTVVERAFRPLVHIANAYQIEMEVEVDTVNTLMYKIRTGRVFPSPVSFNVMLGDEELHGDRTLSSYGVNADNSTVYLNWFV